MTKQFFLNLTPLSLALSLPIAFFGPFPGLVGAQLQSTPLNPGVFGRGEVISARIRFKPPKVGAPAGNREVGASRGVKCSLDKKPLSALLPESSVGLTVAQYPSFFVHLPQHSARRGEFALRDETNRKIVYKMSFANPATSGTFRFTLPLQPLEMGKKYCWFFSLICDPKDLSEIAVESWVERWVVGGWIQRVEPSPTLVSQLEKAAARDRPALYAEAGIWHETLTTLAELRQAHPEDASLAADWAELLNSEAVGLSRIAKEPLLKLEFNLP